jgi:hypothetical protein
MRMGDIPVLKLVFVGEIWCLWCRKKSQRQRIAIMEIQYGDEPIHVADRQITLVDKDFVP